jgi:hypothetical protein
MKTLKHFILAAIIMAVSIAGSITAKADIGPKPTLDIYVENVKDSNYYLDLLGKVGEYGYFDSTNGNEAYNHLHNEPIYKYEADGWKAIHMRTWVLFGELQGEVLQRNEAGKSVKLKHSFSYMGVPKQFKIIIQHSDGTLQVSDIINNNYFNAVVRYDAGENKVLSVTGLGGPKEIRNLMETRGVSDYLKRLILTLFIEIIIALFFGYRALKKLSIIGAANFITQTLLTFLFILGYNMVSKLSGNAGYFILLILGEVLVIALEYFAYSRTFGKVEVRKVLIYTLVANAASILAGFVIPIN